MQISRVVVRNYRALENVDVSVCEDLCCVIGENNSTRFFLAAP